MESANEILQTLGFHDLQTFLAQQQITIDTIERKTNLSSEIIKAKLIEYQNKYLTHVIQPLSDLKPSIKNGFRLNNFFPSGTNLTFWPQRIQMQQAYEVTGKANSGKTYFCYCLLEQALSNSKQVILFDTTDNFCPEKLAQWFGAQFINKYKNFIKLFPVKSIKQLGQYLHYLGKLLKSLDMPSVIIIDSLSTLIEVIPFTENSSTFSAIRRLFHSLIDTSMSCILFTTLSHSNLFQTTYTKNQETRFKNMHAAMWDSLANNAIMLDSCLQINQITSKVIRKTKMCLIKAAKQNRFASFQFIQH